MTDPVTALVERVLESTGTAARMAEKFGPSAPIFADAEKLARIVEYLWTNTHHVKISGLGETHVRGYATHDVKIAEEDA